MSLSLSILDVLANRDLHGVILRLDVQASILQSLNNGDTRVEAFHALDMTVSKVHVNYHRASLSELDHSHSTYTQVDMRKNTP